MLIGIVGAPNKGKSTLFSAMTMADVEIANYPFTTIDPNFGVCYAEKECVEKELHVKCNARNSLCINGMRRIPANIVDIAGIVPQAHLGKGLGNRFLNDIMGADVLIQVVDLSGGTDVGGEPCAVGCNPADDVKMFGDELAQWLASILKKHLPITNRDKEKGGDQLIAELLSGFKIKPEQVMHAAEQNALGLSKINWSDDELTKFASSLMKISKPVIVAANKLDKCDDSKLQKLRSDLPGYSVIGCSGAIELALRKAEKNGMISYDPLTGAIEKKNALSADQEKGISYMQEFVRKHKGTGVQSLVNEAVFGLMKRIAVYPVEDENKYADHFGNVLPDAILVGEGATAQDLAAAIHTELADKMLYAVDVKKKVRIGKDYLLKDNDVIKIVSAAK